MKDSNQIIHQQRRHFLNMLSKAGIASALLNASSLVGGLMATRFAHAQGGIKRVIFVYTPNGAPKGKWLPANLGTMNDATKAYLPVSSYCNFVPVEIVNSGHGQASKCLSEMRFDLWSSPLGDTIDQQIARCIGINMPFQSYFLGVQTAGVDLISRKSGSPIPSEDSPAAAYQKLFGTSSASDLNPKINVLDLHRDALNGLKNKMGSFEKNLLETHEASLASLQNRLTSLRNACASPVWNANGYNTQGPAVNGEKGIFKQQAELQADIIVAALSCGLTNVITLQLGNTQADWYGYGTNCKSTHHNAGHTLDITGYSELTNQLSGCVAYLIKKLIDTPDPAVPGTRLINNTVLLQVTDMGDGTDHSGANGPNLLATAMPGFKSGKIFTQNNGNNLQLLEGIVAGLGLSQYLGTDPLTAKIWPCAGGQPNYNILS